MMTPQSDNLGPHRPMATTVKRKSFWEESDLQQWLGRLAWPQPSNRWFKRTLHKLVAPVYTSAQFPTVLNFAIRLLSQEAPRSSAFSTVRAGSCDSGVYAGQQGAPPSLPNPTSRVQTGARVGATPLSILARYTV